MDTVDMPIRLRCPRCLDFHAHFLHPDVYARTQAFSPATCFGALPLSLENPRWQGMLDNQRMVADLDAAGIDAAVISSADVLQSRSQLSVQDELELTQRVNDRAVDWVARHPTRLIGSFCVPLGDAAHAERETRRALDMGLRIAILPSNYRGSYLGEDPFRALWELFHSRSVITFIHPDGVQDRWFQSYALWNSIGQSIEEVKVMASLIYQGVLDRHPGLRIVMAHGGGYMPYYMGRLDRNARYRPQTTRNLSKLPSHYLRDFYYDSCVYDARTLERLVSVVGADRIVLGGDYPFADVGAPDLVRAADLSAQDRGWILGGTAAALLAPVDGEPGS